MERVLITGANGFIGSNLCSYFLDHSYEVFGLVRETSDLHFLEGLGVRLIRGDLRNIECIDIPPIDYVIHAASRLSDAMTMEEARQQIHDTTVNLVSRLRDRKISLKRFVYISSALVLGHRARDISPQNPGEPPAGVLPYSRAKEMTELFLTEEHRRHGLPVVILRPGDVFGPNDRTVGGRLLESIDGGMPTIIGTGNRLLSFCYVGNVAQACLLACQMRGKDGSAYTITNDQEITWRQLMGSFQTLLGKRQRVFVPAFAAYAIALVMQMLHALIPGFDAILTFYPIHHLLGDTTYDIRQTIEELGYRPNQDIKAQIESIVAWYMKEKAFGYRIKLGGR
jgi:nucleoside-diphosphate-sugar epimerase